MLSNKYKVLTKALKKGSSLMWFPGIHGIVHDHIVKVTKDANEALIIAEISYSISFNWSMNQYKPNQYTFDKSERINGKVFVSWGMGRFEGVLHWLSQEKVELVVKRLIKKKYLVDLGADIKAESERGEKRRCYTLADQFYEE